MNFYVDERQRKGRRRIFKLKVFAGFFLFLALIIGGGYLVVYSPLFRIKNILILRTSDVPSIDENLRTSDVQKLEENLKKFFANQSKITKFLGSENILVWNIEKITQFSKNPEIAEIKIEKNYIEREIRIMLREREKLGIWCLSEQSTVNGQELITGSCYWFDMNGVVFSEAPIAEGNLIYKVDDFSGRPLKFGDAALKEGLFFNLIKIFKTLEESGLGIKSLKLEKIEFQEVSTISSPPIYFSLRIDPTFALAAVDSMKKIGLESIEYIDFRAENRAYYKLK